MKRLLIVGAVILAMSALAVTMLLKSYLDSPLAVPNEGITYMVKPGASLNRVAAELSDAEILPWPRVFTLWVRSTGNAAKLKAGEYEILADTTPRGLLTQLLEGQVVQHSFTILEGWTVRELLAAMAETDQLNHTLKDDERDANGNAEPESLTDLLELAADHPEGQFFPDTYQFPRGYSDVDVLRLAADLMQKKLAAAWSERAENLPLENAYELLTLASIIERETGLDSERKQVAGVFVRRLRKGMRLQTDPTVIYGLGDDFDGNLTREHLETDTPYNTYTRSGLPPTPIAMPGEASLLAAADPAGGTALFFVAKGDGSAGHVFSDTLEQHNQAVAKYLARLREARRRERAGKNQ